MRSSGIVGPQQLVFGNGATIFSPLTEGDVVAHEFGHLVTDQFSNLTYSNQSGGMNEAFSDMTGMAFNSYLRHIGFTWYWDGKDWTTGLSIAKNNKPTRSLSDPTSDGVSIDNAANFRTGMNTHNSSGVYNKAFYLLSTTTGWTIEKAYQVMLDANMNYWTANTDYNNGACGVRSAAIARGYSGTDVDNAFSKVGVKCPH
jgi:Zn-dependent metalloprotease